MFGTTTLKSVRRSISRVLGWNRSPHADAIQKNYDVLQRCTTINFYVIDFLRAKDVLDEAQESDLKAERSHLKQRILLYQWLKVVSSDKYESFLQVMKDTEQEHVANLLTGSTEEEHLPLSDARYIRLVQIRHKMANVTQIDSEVIAELRSMHAISMTDAEEVRAEKVDSTKVSKLISVIMRRSNYSYNSFQDVLRNTLQTVAANFLIEGEMPTLHVKNNRPDLDEPLSHAFNGVIRNRATDDAETKALLEEMDEIGLDPANAKPGRSIVISMYCKTVDDAVKFTQLYNTGRVQYILESILNRLLLTIEPHNKKKLDSRVSLEEEDAITLEEFTGIEDWVREDLKRPRALRKIRGCNAATQTDETSLKKKITGGLPVKYESDPTLIGTILIENEKPGRNSINGMTILDKELFIMSETSTEVVVYDSMTFNFNRRWDLKELNCLMDIGSCSLNKCLYVVGSQESPKTNEIWRVNSNGKLINKWSTDNDYECSLSVTNESNVILAASNSIIIEYSPDGQMISKIILPFQIYHPLHAIKLASGKFVVSHRCPSCGSQYVCIVDVGGRIRKSFELKNISTYMYDDSIYLCVDGNGFVLIVDREEGRVLLLDSDLEFKGNILSRETHKLRVAWRILLDESNGRLFVADGYRWNVNKILIFRFNK